MQSRITTFGIEGGFGTPMAPYSYGPGLRIVFLLYYWITGPLTHSVEAPD